MDRPYAPQLSAHALSTPEPLVRAFARRVQQEGALDLTQGDYKNADFAPHPEVVRAAQRITRNTVHSYGPAVGRMDVRSEIAEFFNRDGRIDYPSSDVRFLPDEVLFTSGTRSGLAMVLEVLGADGTGVVVPRPSWEYDWFVERAGKHLVELPTAPPEFLPDPEELDRLLAAGGISSVIINNPHNPTGRVYPRELVEALVDVAVRHGAYVLYDSVYQRLDYVGAFVNPAFARPEWRDWVVTLSGLSKMDMFGASTGARACWLVLSDQIQVNGVRAREVIANLSAWLVATPSTLAQDWALAALQSPLAALRRPSPYMRERRDFMVKAADEIAGLGVERTDFGGTFYAPLAFPGLVGERFERLRNGLRERATVRTADDAFDFLLTAGVGGIPFTAFAGRDPARYGTWQRLSYGSKDVGELAVFIDRVRRRIERQGRLGSSAPAPGAARPAASRRPRPRPIEDAVWSSVCTEDGYEALDGLDAATFEAARRGRQRPAWPDPPRLTGTKHPDSTIHRAEQLARAIDSDADADRDHASRVLGHLEWHPLVEARQEFEETITDLLGPCNEVLLDFEGRQISPEWLDVPEKVVLALLRHGLVPGEDCHLLFRVPNPWLEQDEEKIEKILAVVARANVLFLLAARRLGLEPAQNAIYELTVPQVNARADLGALMKIGTLYRQAIDHLFHGSPDRVDAFLAARIPEADRADLIARVARVRLVPLVENVGALSHLPDLLESFYAMLERNRGVPGLPSASSFVTRAGEPAAIVRVFVAMSDTAEQSGKIATDAAYALMVAGRDDAERRLADHARRAGEPAPKVTFLVGAGRAGFRGGLRPGARRRHRAVRARGRRHAAGHPGRRAGRGGAPGGEVPRGAAARRGRPRSSMRPTATRWAGCSNAGVKAHTATLLAIAPLVAPFGGLVPQTRVRIRATGSVNYGRSIPEYPEEWGGGRRPPGQPRPSRRLAGRRHAAARHRLQPGLHDARPPGRGERPRRARQARGRAARPARARLPRDPRERTAVASSASRSRSSSAGASPRRWPGAACGPPPQSGRTSACARTWCCRRACSRCSTCATSPRMPTAGTRPRSTRAWRRARANSSATPATGRSRRSAPSGPATAGRSCRRWWTPTRRARLLLARELTIEEKREFVDLRIEGWLRALPDTLSRELRRAWAPLRELDKDALTLRAIEQMIALEQLRGSRGA